MGCAETPEQNEINITKTNLILLCWEKDLAKPG